MKSTHKLNIEEALQLVAKLELLLKMVEVTDTRNLDEIQGKLFDMWKNTPDITNPKMFCTECTEKTQFTFDKVINEVATGDDLYVFHCDECNHPVYIIK